MIAFIVTALLKIEDALTSTAQFKNYKIYHALGSAIQITKVQEDTKYKQTNYFFDVLFGFGKYEGPTNQEVQYHIRRHISRTFGKTCI